MSDFESRKCTECKKLISKWFTTHTDKRPFCGKCATDRFKAIHPGGPVKLKHPCAISVSS